MGDISSWFIQELAGLKPNPNVDDIKYFEISPHFVKQLDRAKAHYESQFGKVSVNWERIRQTVKLEISMPEGTYGKAVLPEGFCFENSAKSIELTEGSYEFTVKKEIQAE